MRAFRPSRFGEPDEQDLAALIEAKEQRMSMYQRRVEEDLPIFEAPEEEVASWPSIRKGGDEHREATGYRIVWEYLDTGRRVVGVYTFPSLEVAQAIARAMDALWPEIRHRPIAAREAQLVEAGAAAGK